MEYVLKCLMHGTALHESLRLAVERETDRIVAMLPKDAPTEYAQRPEHGFWMDGVEPAAWISTVVRCHLQQGEGRSIVLPITAQGKTRFRRSFGEVNLLDRGESSFVLLSPAFQSVDTIIEIVCTCLSRGAEIAVLTNVSKDRSTQFVDDSVGDAVLHKCAEEATEVICYAYDGEGYILWQRRKKANLTRKD